MQKYLAIVFSLLLVISTPALAQTQQQYPQDNRVITDPVDQDDQLNQQDRMNQQDEFDSDTEFLDDDQDPEGLPATASPLALLALLGLGSLSGAAILRKRNK